jgi:hypothetical protein
MANATVVNTAASVALSHCTKWCAFGFDGILVSTGIIPARPDDVIFRWNRNDYHARQNSRHR